MRLRPTQLAAALAAGLLTWIVSTGIAFPPPQSTGGGVEAESATATHASATRAPIVMPSATQPQTITGIHQAPPLTQAAIEPVEAATATPLPLFWPTPDAGVAQRGLVLPILTYHYVEPWPDQASPLRQGLTVRPDDFAAQMQFLVDEGYTTISLYALIDSLATGTPLPERPVVLTFDDGYAGLFDYAAPVLLRADQTATVFVITEFVDQERPEYLSWSDLRFMHSLGWSVEPHTKTHIGLDGLRYERQLYEMLGSIETIEANLGVRPRFFNYPSGSYDETTLALAPEVGLWGGVTTAGGWYHRYADRYTLTRIRVTGHTDLAHFAEILDYGR
ncbi:MAG TPA: polysaccharide deacetylase family protein [Anaerolineales bacterium]|nr:polysaccharide deacetylase family protein [Anaerolineales bacterium]HRF46118.1 polysaccharide deacetylase family protein [Anaerolineales bacterium]